MSSGSIDYWATKDNWMYALLTIVKDAVKEGGLIQTAIDSMDGKLDGVVDLTKLTADDTGILAGLLSIDGGLATGSDLLDKLDNLDGVADGVLDLNALKTFDIFYDGVAEKSRLEVSIDKLILSLTQLTGVHTDTTAMVAFGSQSFGGSHNTSTWSLVSSYNAKRNMLEITMGTQPAYYSRNGSTSSGTIDALAEAVFHDAPGVWLKGVAGSGSWTAYEEWAT